MEPISFSRVLLLEIVGNLVVNAIKFGDALGKGFKVEISFPSPFSTVAGTRQFEVFFWKKLSLVFANKIGFLKLTFTFFLVSGPIVSFFVKLRKLMVSDEPSGARRDSETVDGEIKGGLVSDVLASMRFGVVAGGACIEVFSGELESGFFSLVREGSTTVSFGGEVTLDLLVVVS